MAERYIFTSESVTEGHPDKVCDKISDSILDAVLAKDPQGRVAVETLVTTGLVVVAGELTTTTYVDIPKVVRNTVREIGYHDSLYGFHADDVGVIVSIDEQSPDIAQGVTRGRKKLGAGDQGIMFGFATKETPELMPLPITLAHGLAKRLTGVRKRGLLRYLRPDGKTEVAVEYVDGRPTRIDTVVVAAQHGPDVTEARVRRDILREVVRPVCRRWIDRKTRLFVNETGKFVKGGPPADAGLTGRKIIVDTYGGAAPHGGGAFSGKDPTKVDRSATYAARWIAKNVVAAGLAEQCLVQLSYVIGVADPVSVHVDTKGTGQLADARLERIIRRHFDLTPAGFIRDLKLRRPIYAETAAYGHFGRPGFPWEQTNKVRVLRRYVR